MTASDGHEVGTVILEDAASYLRRSDLASRQAWAGQHHLVELRSWIVPIDDDGNEIPAILVESLCRQVCLRVVFEGCGRPLADHSGAEVLEIMATALAEHAKRCADERPILEKIVKLS
jgi:hypothetical protein